MMRVVDLTLPLSPATQTFPVHWHPRVQVEPLGTHRVEQRETRRLVLGTHSGTHVDAPRHFVPGGASVDEIPLSKLWGPATLVNLTRVRDRESVNEGILARVVGRRPTERLVLRFDGDRRVGTPEYYSEQPWLTTGAAEWIVEQGCVLLGLDVAMPDNPTEGYGAPIDSPIHKILLSNEIVLVEYLSNLRFVAAEVFELVVAPLKIVEGDGAPARCFARFEGSSMDAEALI